MLLPEQHANKEECLAFVRFMGSAPLGQGQFGGYDWGALTLAWEKLVDEEWVAAKKQQRRPSLFHKTARQLENQHRSLKTRNANAAAGADRRAEIAALRDRLRVGAPAPSLGTISTSINPVNEMSSLAFVVDVPPPQLTFADLDRDVGDALPAPNARSTVRNASRGRRTATQSLLSQVDAASTGLAVPAGSRTTCTKPKASSAATKSSSTTTLSVSPSVSRGRIIYLAMQAAASVVAPDIVAVQQRMLKSGHYRKCCKQCGHFFYFGLFSNCHDNLNMSVCRTPAGSRVPKEEIR